MFKKLILLFVLAFFGSTSPLDLQDIPLHPIHGQDQHLNLKRDKIVLIGDSITQMASQVSLNGWAASLLSTYQRKLDILNRGAGGYTTKWYLPYINETMQNAQADGSTVHAS